MKLSFLLSALVFTFSSHLLAAECFTENTTLLYRCEGQALNYSHNGKPYRAGSLTEGYHVSICQDSMDNLLMEVFPFGHFTDHAKASDYDRPTVRAAIVSDTGIEGRSIYKLGCTRCLNSSTSFSVVSENMDNQTFSAKFYMGTWYKSSVQGDVLCTKY